MHYGAVIKKCDGFVSLSKGRIFLVQHGDLVYIRACYNCEINRAVPVNYLSAELYIIQTRGLLKRFKPLLDTVELFQQRLV